MRYMGLWTYHKAAHVNELCSKDTASENILNTCLVLFGSILLNNVSSFVLLVWQCSNPLSLPQLQCESRPLCGDIPYIHSQVFVFSFWFICFVFFFCFCFVLFPCHFLPLSPQRIPVVAVGIICTISRLCSENATVWVKACHLSIFFNRGLTWELLASTQRLT